MIKLFAAGMITLFAGILMLSAPARAVAGELAFLDAYGTFKDPKNAVDGDPTTFAEATGTPYRGEYFLIVRISSNSLLRKITVRFEGKAPARHNVDMSSDAVGWRAYELGEKALYLKIRMPAKDGDIFKIAEIELQSEAVGDEAFIPDTFGVTDIETTSVTLHVVFPKPFKLSVTYGLEARQDAQTNFTEFTSYLTTYKVPVTGLIEGQDYFIRIKAISISGDVFAMEDTTFIQFRLKGIPPLKVVKSGVAYVNPLAISLVVQTNIPAHCIFYFGEGMMMNQIMSKPEFETNHIFEFKNLWPNRLYSYMAHITDFRGLTITLPKQQITTSVLNIARGKRVIEGTFSQLREPGWQGGGHNQGDTVLQRITDGKNDYFTGMAHSGNVKQADQYAVIDLGKVYTLESHSIGWRKLAYPNYYEIWLSVDKKDWKKAFALTPDRRVGGQEMRSGGGDPLLIHGGQFYAQYSARYVKLFIPKGVDHYVKHRDWVNVDLAELMVFPGGEYPEIQKIAREEWQP